jgi:hypothetical protein
VRAGEMGAAEPNSVLRPGFPADAYWLCWMRLDEAESFFISHIRQGLRILLFLFGNSY